MEHGCGLDPGGAGKGLAIAADPRPGGPCRAFEQAFPFDARAVLQSLDLQDRDRAALHRHHRLFRAEEGAGFAVHALGKAGKDDDHLALHVQALVIVKAEIGAIDAKAGEHQRRLDHQRLVGQAGAQGGLVGGQRHGGPAICQRNARSAFQSCLAKGDGLVPRSVGSGRLQAERGKARGDIARGDVEPGGSGIAPGEQIVGQERDIGGDIGGMDGIIGGAGHGHERGGGNQDGTGEHTDHRWWPLVSGWSNRQLVFIDDPR